jgi:hypothetical protein
MAEAFSQRPARAVANRAQGRNVRRAETGPSAYDVRLGLPERLTELLSPNNLHLPHHGTNGSARLSALLTTSPDKPPALRISGERSGASPHQVCRPFALSPIRRFAPYPPTIQRTTSSEFVACVAVSPTFFPRRSTTMRSLTAKISIRL